MQKIITLSLSFLVAACLAQSPLSASPAFEQKDPSQVGWKAKFLGSRYEVATDTTSFFYSLTIADWEKDLSHWILSLDLDEAPVANGDATCYGLDPTTGLFGLKWDRPQLSGTTAEYSITVRGRVAERTTTYAVKGATYFAVDTITGPGAAVAQAATYAIEGFAFVDANKTSLLEVDEPGLPNVRVILSDATGQSLAVAHTDGQGRYRFEGLQAGTYLVHVPAQSQGNDFNAILATYFQAVQPLPLAVTLSTSDSLQNHLGYALLPLAVLLDFDSTDVDGNGVVFSGTGKTIGFWSHQNSVALTGRGRAQVDKLTLLNYLSTVEGLYLTEPFQFTDGAEYKEALDILRLNTREALGLLCKQLLATELNHVAGLGLTGEWNALQGSLIAWAEYLAKHSTAFTRDELLTAKDICDLINNTGNN